MSPQYSGRLPCHPSQRNGCGNNGGYCGPSNSVDGCYPICPSSGTHYETSGCGNGGPLIGKFIALPTANPEWHNLCFHAVQQSQRDPANGSLIDNILAFDGKPELYFDWILKLENITAIT